MSSDSPWLPRLMFSAQRLVPVRSLDGVEMPPSAATPVVQEVLGYPVPAAE